MVHVVVDEIVGTGGEVGAGGRRGRLDVALGVGFFGEFEGCLEGFEVGLVGLVQRDYVFGFFEELLEVVEIAAGGYTFLRIVTFRWEVHVSVLRMRDRT